VYTGANTQNCQFCSASATKTLTQLMPLGTATFQARNSHDVWMSVLGRGRDYSVSVDGGTAKHYATTTCGCWEVDPIATGLSLATHRIVVKNKTKPELDPQTGPTGGMSIQAWWVDSGGVFLQNSNAYNSTHASLVYSSVTFVADAGAQSGTLAMVPTGSTITFYAENASAVQLELVENATTYSSWQNDKLTRYKTTLASTGKYRQFRFIDWGLPRGLTKLTVRVTSGTLKLDRVLLLQTSGLGPGTLVSPGDAQSVPELAGYGDSITMGNYTLGPTGSADGYADRLATLEGLRLADVALGGTSATCYGQTRVSTVVNTKPDAVVVAFGVNDVLGDFYGCKPTMDQFHAAMESTVDQLQSRLPGIPVYLGSILPTVKIPEDVRTQWNQVIEDVALEHGLLYLDPSVQLNMAVDYQSPLHPNNSGAAKIASAWARAIPSDREDLSIGVAGSPDPASVGSPVTFDLTVTNGGLGTSSGVTVTDALPPNVTLQSATPSQGSCTAGTRVICVLGQLGASESASVTLVLVPQSTGTLGDTAAVAAWELDPSMPNNVGTDSVTVQPA